MSARRADDHGPTERDRRRADQHRPWELNLSGVTIAAGRDVDQEIRGRLDAAAASTRRGSMLIADGG